MTIAAIPLTRLEDRLQSDPLTSEHRRELSAARDRGKVIRKAARVAAFNGWTTALIAAVSALIAVVSGLFSPTSPVALALTAGLTVVAFNEFRGRKRLLNFDPRGATLLGWNQVGLLAIIIVYCLWSMYSGTHGSGELEKELNDLGDLNAALGMSPGGLNDLTSLIAVAFYGIVIVLSVLFQGGNALYYFTRRRHVEEFVAETPAWVRDIERGSHPA